MKIFKNKRPILIAELIIIIYFITYGPLAPIMPFTIGYKSISDNINTIYYTGFNRKTAHKVLRLTKQAQADIMRFWCDEKYPRGVKVYLTDSKQYFHYAMYNNNSSAFIQGNSIIINQDKSMNSISTILTHEMSHHYLSHKFSAGIFTRYIIPRWLDEGLAVLISKDRLYTDDLLRTILKDNPHQLSLKDLTSGLQWYRSYQKNRQDIIYSYSRTMVGYILNNYGKEKIRQILNKISLINNSEKVIEEELGIELENLEKNLLIYLFS